MWKTVKLGDVCDLQNGFAFKSSDYVDNSNTLNIRMSNIRPNGKFDESHNIKFLPDNYATKYAEYKLIEGDLIIAMTDMAGNPKILGMPTIVKNLDGRAFLLNQRVGKLHKFSDEIFVPYLCHFLSTLKNFYKNKGAGGLQINISKKDILSAKIPLPPLAEQQRIVAKLDAAFAEIDGAKEFHGRKTQECGSLVNIVISKILKKFAEQNSTSSSLGEVTYTAGRIGWKGLTRKEYVGQGYLFLSVHGLNYGKFVDFGDAFRITKERFEESPEIMLEQGDVLLCKDGAGIGKLAIVNELNEPATINSSLLLIRPNESLSSEYVYYYLLASEFQLIIQSKIDGATTPHLYQRDIRNLPIIFPEKRFQKQAVAEIEAAIAKIEEIRLSSVRNSINYAALKSAILAQELQSEAA